MKMLVLAAALVASASVATVASATPAYPVCSNAGDQTVRPVFKRVNGKVVLVGYECAQDNRGGGGGVRF